jgi:hypothetical protein
VGNEDLFWGKEEIRERKKEEREKNQGLRFFSHVVYDCNDHALDYTLACDIVVVLIHIWTKITRIQEKSIFYY